MDSLDFDSDAVSPVVGVILVVAVTVALSGVIGVFVFDLSQTPSDSTESNLGTRTTYDDGGTATIQVVTGEADELRVLVNGTEEGNITNPEPGDTVSIAAAPDSKITVVEVTDGESSVASSSSGSGSGGYASNTAPTAVASADSTLVNEGNTVNFDGSGSSDADGSIEPYEWDFDGDGTYDATGVTASHTYENAGEYQATLRVTDNGGTSATDTITIEVESGAPTTGLIAHYAFEGDATDETGNQDGTFHGNPQFETRADGQALVLDGGDDYVDLNSRLFSDYSTVTISSWVKTTSTEHDVITTSWTSSTSETVGLRVKNDKVRGSVDVSGSGNIQNTYSANAVNDGSWNLISMTFDDANNTVRVYVDGQLSNTRTDITNSPTPTDDYNIGRSPYPNAYFSGSLDDVRYYNRVLSGSEIEDLYNATK